MSDTRKLNDATGSFVPVNVVAADPAEADWNLPSDLVFEQETFGRQSSLTGERKVLENKTAIVGGTPPVELRQPAAIVSDGMPIIAMDRISIALTNIISDLEAEVSKINSEGVKQFNLSEYRSAKDIAELGNKIQQFCLKMRVLRSDWAALSDKTVIYGDAEASRSVDIPPEASKKSSRSKLVVMLNDGRVICGDTPAETFTRSIEEIGVQKVQELGLEVKGKPLISNTNVFGYNQSNFYGYYVNTNSRTLHKKKLLEKIAEEIGISWTVKVSI